MIWRSKENSPLFMNGWATNTALGEIAEARDAFDACFKIRKALALQYPGRPRQQADLASSKVA